MILRVRYAKLGKVRFTSHRDTARIWERAMRKAQIPVITSGGFTPRPRLSFGLALPTGAESIAEYLDVELIDGAPLDVGALPERLTNALPGGFTALQVAGREGGRSLQDEVTSVTWQLEVPAGYDVGATIVRLLNADQLPLERERKRVRHVDDVRPLIMSLAPCPDGTRLVAQLATVGRGLRPAELATVAFPGAAVAALRVLRTHQWIEHDGNRRPPLSDERVVLPDAVLAPLVGA
jgi:radical SAM-linked protein